MNATTVNLTRLADLPLRAPVAVGPDATVLETARRLRAANVSSVLVGHPGTLVSIVTERDIVEALAQGVDPEMAISSFAVPNPLTIAADATLGEAGERMVASGVRHLVVTDDSTAIAVVSIRDVVVALLSEASTSDATIAVFCGAVGDRPEFWLG